MKKLMSIVLVSFLAIGTMAFAGARAQGWKVQRSLSTQDDFQALKPGDQIAQVCKMCDSVSIIEVESTEGAMAFCKEGSVVSCPSCKMKATVTLKGPRPENNRRVVRYVDQHGDACMFMAKIEKSDEDGGSIHRGPDTPHRSHR